MYIFKLLTKSVNKIMQTAKIDAAFLYRHKASVLFVLWLCAFAPKFPLLPCSAHRRTGFLITSVRVIRNLEERTAFPPPASAFPSSTVCRVSLVSARAHTHARRTPAGRRHGRRGARPAYFLVCSLKQRVRPRNDRGHQTALSSVGYL